jgi:hypothetical protein
MMSDSDSNSASRADRRVRAARDWRKLCSSRAIRVSLAIQVGILVSRSRIGNKYRTRGFATAHRGKPVAYRTSNQKELCLRHRMKQSVKN